MSYGCDLLDVFPQGLPPGGSYSLIQRFKHILSDLAGRSTAAPGEKFQYKISCVDLAGRKSMTEKESAVVRLEKRQPPPPPGGLEEKHLHPADNGYRLSDLRRAGIRPQNVYSRVLYANAKDLTAADRTLLGDRDHLTILTWTWDDNEIALDPLVKEFRIYLRRNEHATVKGTCSGEAAANGAKWNIEAALSAAVCANEFAWRYLTLNKLPFRIISHTAGDNVTFIVEEPASVPGQPREGVFELYRKSSGEDVRPTGWDQRIAVIPRKTYAVYQYVLETGVLLSEPSTLTGLTGIAYDITPEGKDIRCWLGVSAADNESYVSDQVTTAEAYSPRAGNESTVATAEVRVKYIGRPVFNPPPPLEDVPVTPLDEARSDELLLAVTPYELLPFLEPHSRLHIERISGTDLLSLLHVEESSIQIADAENPVIVTDWILNPADEAELRNVFTSTSKPIPARFIWALSKRNDIHLDVLWKQVNPEPVLCTDLLTDRLPNSTERYIYRARLVNAIGIPSERAAFFPNVWRASDKTKPGSVTVTNISIAEEGDSVRVSPVIKMDAAFAGPVKGILVFAAAFPSAENITEAQLTKAALLKIPNRPDFLSEQLYRLRAGSQLIEPFFVSITETTRATNAGSVTLAWENNSVDAPYEHTVVVWAAAVSNDNVLSSLSVFKQKFTGLVPPVMPDLMIATNDTALELSFAATSIDGFMYRIEQSMQNEEEGFAPVTGWFKASDNNTREFDIPPGERWFRLKLRNINQQEYTGIAIHFNP